MTVRYEIVPWSAAQHGLPAALRRELRELYDVPESELRMVWCVLAVRAEIVIPPYGPLELPLCSKPERVIGIMRFHHADHWLSDCGTVVLRAFRFEGHALRMWREAIEQLAISEVAAWPVSSEGAGLIGKVAQFYADRVAFTLTPP